MDLQNDEDETTKIAVSAKHVILKYLITPNLIIIDLQISNK